MCWLESEPFLGGEWARVMVLMLLLTHYLVKICSTACITMMISMDENLSPCLMAKWLY